MRPKSISLHDDTIRRLSSTLTDSQIAERIGATRRAVAKRRWKIGIIRRKAGAKAKAEQAAPKLRDLFPVMAKQPTPQDAEIEALTNRWMA